MRGVKYVTYAFMAILGTTVMLSFLFNRFSQTMATRHTETFLRILSACSILLTFVFYYNLIKSEDEQRTRAEQLDTDRELDRLTNQTVMMTEMSKPCPNTVQSVVTLNINSKYKYFDAAKASGELEKKIEQYRISSTIFDLWASNINCVSHRKPQLVNRVARMITQAASPVLREAWNVVSYQYSVSMNDFVEEMYQILDGVSKDSYDYPQYLLLSIKVLEKMDHVTVYWDCSPKYYVFNELKYVDEKTEHFF